jgi:16S rRNA (uracil1498-N3)-methyltransferase
MASLKALACWQARPGSIYTVTDPNGTDYRVRIVSLIPGQARCVPFEIHHQPVESHLQVTVYQALPERERFELVLQKLTELGVDRVGAIETERSTTRVERDARQSKSHRWPDVLRRAALQCRRAMMPELLAVQSFAEAVEEAASADLKLICHAGPNSRSITEVIGGQRPGTVALLIGPEGGFAPAEIALASRQGVQPVTFGPRILRTETAAIVVTAMIQNCLGDLK